MNDQLKQAIINEYRGKQKQILRYCLNDSLVVGDYVDDKNMLWYVILKDGILDVVSAVNYPILFTRDHPTEIIQLPS